MFRNVPCSGFYRRPTGIPGMERLADDFESRGFSTRKSLQYLQVGDLDYIFSSPKRLLLAEKRALDHELRQLKLKSQEPGSTARLMPKQLQFSSNEPQTWRAEGETATASNSISTTTCKIDSPLDRRKQELVENVSFLEAQISSAEDHLAKLKGENNLLQTISRGRICSHCHQSGHNRNNCRGIACDSHTKCKLKDKHPELGKSISETQKMLTVLRKNKETAKQSLEQFMLQLQRSRGNFFAVMRPRLKRLNPVKYLNHQELDKDLLYLHKALENKVPPESEDWRLPYLIDNCKGQVSSFKESAALLPISLPANPPENSFYNGFSVNNHGANSTSNVSVRFHPYQL